MTITARILTLLLALIALPASDLIAQTGGRAPDLPLQAPQRGRGRAAAAERGISPAEVLNMLDAYAVLQAGRILALSDAQEGEFVVRLKRLQQTRRRNQQARNRLVQELRQLVRPDVAQVDEAAVRDRLKQLREVDERAAAELKSAYAVLDEALDVRQQARFRIFEETLERRKLDLLMRARQTAPGDARQ